MKKIDSYCSQMLHRVWRSSMMWLAKPGFAMPGQIPVAAPNRSLYAYLQTAIRHAAPWSTALMVCATIAATLCHISLSWALGQLTDAAMHGYKQTVIHMTLLLLALWLASPLFQILQSIARLFSTQNLRIAITDHLSARLMQGQASALHHNSVGNLVERIELAAGNAPAVVSSMADTIVKLLSVTILMSLILVSVSPLLALGAAVWMVSALLLSSYLAWSGMSIVEDASDAHASVISELNELVCNISLIKSFLAQKAERKRFGAFLQSDLLACRRVRSYWVFVLLLETAWKWLFGIALMLYGLSLYSSAEISLPQLVTLCSLVISLSWHFESMAFHFVDLFDAAGVLRASLREVYAIPLSFDPEADTPPLPTPGSIELRNVNFSHEGKPVLQNVSLIIPPGGKCALIGPSGAGKSTLLDLLRGELKPDSGEILIHGLPLSALPPATLAHNRSESLQSALMFNRSLRENLAYGQLKSDTEIEQALQYAQATQLVEALPKRLESQTGERGGRLSTGEKQRISIARALLKPAPLLLLDEATASVDVISERKILEHICTHMPKTTVITVSHRVASLSNFEHIILLEQGRLIALGCHSQLQAEQALYRQLLLESEDQYSLAA
ncbi:ABC transporter ATP-binding protein [Massilia sp. W12]|uniref:ABC transporter ATP-binding protein n=1 Tax=Massilia sp. W12 TaxID=3126507 RepID=UPI0030D1DC53